MIRFYAGPFSIREGLDRGVPDRRSTRAQQPIRCATGAGSLAPDVDATYFALGKWAEAGQLATAAGALGWFAAPGPDGQVRALLDGELPPDLAELLVQIDERIDAGPTTADLPHLRAALRELILRGGGGVPSDTH